MIAGSPVWTGDKRQLSLGALLKSGGAGGVYRLNGLPDQVAKIYHDSVDRAYYERKVAAMVKLSPQLPDLVENGKHYVQIAWPEQLLRDGRGRFLGFVMPAVDVQSTSELEVILQDRQARAAGLPTGLGPKITLAANLAAVIAELHKQRHHVVDLKPVNLRFYPQSLYMAMLDCDGFSIQGEGERFDAPQFTPDYLAPEFQGGSIPVAGEEQQDRFALAVVIFQLLNFGIHPFTGRPVSERVPTDIPGRIANRCYAYGLRANASLSPSPASGHAAMPLELRQLFDRAFESRGATRPPAMEWAAVLRGYAQRSNRRLMACSRDPDHQLFTGLPCAACARDALIANTAQKNALAARSAASPVQAMARAIGLRPRYTGLPIPPRRPNPRNLTPRPWRRPPPPPLQPPQPPQPPASLWNRISWYRKFQALVFMVILGPQLLKGLAGMLPNWNPPSSYPADPPAQSQPVETPPSLPPPAPTPTPTAPPTPGIIPIGTSYSLAYGHWLDIWTSLEDSRPYIEGAAIAMASRNKFAYEHSLAYLHAGARAHRQLDAATRAEYESEFARLSDATTLPDEPARTALMIKLQDVLISKDEYDAEATYEWAWLQLASGDHYLSRDALVRAIWADPDHAAAWYGFGVVQIGDDGQSVGAMAIAETLFVNAKTAQRTRDQFSPELLRRLGIDPERFALLQARARRLAATKTGKKLPADIAALADKPLPPR